ncbi:MAG: thiamine diphosphokinase [Candidatus Gottesmanbacteria bacterium]|nr:thiamine diphosphokinase [Candidatus Gottesmanbacteria bacterium]
MKQINTIAIVGGGKLIKKFIVEIRSADYTIGVDRGAYWLILNRVIPDIAIGDFDSVTAREAQLIKKKSKLVVVYPKNKNETDMGLAVEHAIGLHPKEMTFYGAAGDRLDHTMANIHLLEQLDDQSIAGVIRDESNEVRIIHSQVTIKKDARFQYVSILSATETVEVTLIGFVYDLSHAIIHRGQTIGISNEIREDEATIEIHSGKALVIRSRD